MFVILSANVVLFYQKLPCIPPIPFMIFFHVYQLDRLMWLAQVLMAKPFLLLMSSLVSSKLPKYLHFFQDAFSFLLMLYSLVFSLFTFRFLSDSFSGISFLIFPILNLEFIPTHPISSAYC